MIETYVFASRVAAGAVAVPPTSPTMGTEKLWLTNLGHALKRDPSPGLHPFINPRRSTRDPGTPLVLSSRLFHIEIFPKMTFVA